jgi:hypothetical protein
MSFQDDSELEARLRRVAAGPAPDVPASLREHLVDVTAGREGRIVGGVALSPVRPAGRGWSGRRRVWALASLAAVLVIAVSAAGLLVGTRGPQAAATLPLRTDVGQGEWTGLEWHDITATAQGISSTEQWYVGGNPLVAWRGGFAMLGGDMNVWLSKDGLTWTRAAGAPRYAGMVAVGPYLLAWGATTDASGAFTGSGLWRTVDGVTWTSVSMPSAVTPVGLAGSSSGAVIWSTPSDVGQPAGPSQIYLCADAATWTRATLPADLAAAIDVQVSPFLDGFVAMGDVPDPNGNIGKSTDSGPETKYSERSWISRDGLTWTSYQPTLLASDSDQPWTNMQEGRLGAGDGRIHSTDGGVTWSRDRVQLPDSMVGYQLVSDGDRIVMAAGGGGQFYLSEGDGNWIQLEQGGDVGSLPSDGRIMLLPNGVLWIGGGRVYFGQALSGIAPEGSLGPPTSPSPGPSLPYPTSTPAVMVTAAATELPTPATSPSATMTATGFTTPGSTDGWKGFTWTSLPSESRMLPSPQLDGSGIGQILRWKGGYVATGSVALFGTAHPSLGLWTSPDGQTWTPVTSIEAAAVVVSVAPFGLLALAVDPTTTDGQYRPPEAWTSSDGVEWHDAGPSNLPGGLVSIAGTDKGIVATSGVTVGTGKAASEGFLVEFSTDGVNWTQETVGDLAGSQGGAYGLPPHVQTNAGRFYLMGTAPPVMESSGSALGPSLSQDEMWLSGDGETWTRSAGGYSWFADFIDFGRDGILLHTNANASPGANGLAYSTDGGMTWHEDPKFAPLGQEPCQGECATGPDGAIASNGTVFVAVQNGGKKAWLSYDARTWTPIAWAGGDPSAAGYGGFGGFVVMPRGVLLGGAYGAGG